MTGLLLTDQKAGVEMQLWLRGMEVDDRLTTGTAAATWKGELAL